MTYATFARLLQNFATRPVTPASGRHVYAWLGELEKLRKLAPAGLVDVLDLHNLAKFAAKTPIDDSARQVIERLIAQWFNENLNGSRRHVVFITGCDLLARYQVPLNTFFEWSSDEIIFIHVIPNWSSRPLAGKTPEYATFQPQSTLNYLKQIIGDNATIEDEG